jgi:hypothetical protein
MVFWQVNLDGKKFVFIYRYHQFCIEYFYSSLPYIHVQCKSLRTVTTCIFCIFFFRQLSLIYRLSRILSNIHLPNLDNPPHLFLLYFNQKDFHEYYTQLVYIRILSNFQMFFFHRRTNCCHISLLHRFLLHFNRKRKIPLIMFIINI